MRLADYVIQLLARHGIEHAFTVCGGGSIFLCDAMARSPAMKYIACHHEQAAAMAAESYARARESFGLCVVTSGPGGTNAVTGCAGAWTDRVPVVFLSGQVFLSQTTRGHPGLRTMGVQEINIVDIVKSITKYAHMVIEPKGIKYHVEKALWLARSGAPGPVWLDLPADVQNAEIEPDELEGFTPVLHPNPPLIQDHVRYVIELLRQARRPVLHIGQGIRLADAMPELATFLAKWPIPVLTARNGNDLIESDHPLYIGRPGTFAQRGANFAVQTCDLYIAIGTRLSLAQTGYNAKDYARNAKVVMVDIDAAEIRKNAAFLDHWFCVHARAFLSELNKVEGPRRSWSAWLGLCKSWQRAYPPVTDACREQTEFVNSYHFIDLLSDALQPDDIVVTDMGFAFQNTHQAFRVKRGQRLYTNGGLAAMGWGLPAAIGAAVGTKRRVICIAGDGGMMMNLQELATAKHHNLPVKIFILNNDGYLTMRQSQELAFDRYMGSDESSGLSFPDFRMIASANGIPYTMVDSHAELPSAIEQTIDATDGTFICEIMMDPRQIQAPKSVNQRLPDGTIRQTALEDASPFLPPEEIEANLKLGSEV